jgi:hypothetical protein
VLLFGFGHRQWGVSLCWLSQSPCVCVCVCVCVADPPADRVESLRRTQALRSVCVCVSLPFFFLSFFPSPCPRYRSLFLVWWMRQTGGETVSFSLSR